MIMSNFMRSYKTAMNEQREWGGGDTKGRSGAHGEQQTSDAARWRQLMQNEEVEQAALFEWTAYKAGQWIRTGVHVSHPERLIPGRSHGDAVESDRVKSGVPTTYYW